MRTAQSEGLLARAVREAVESVASPEVCEEILGAALRLAGRETVPEAGEPVTQFVEVALREATCERLDPETADMVIEQLRPIATMAARQEVSEVRLSQPPPRSLDLDDDDEPELTIEADSDDTPLLELDLDVDTPPRPRPRERRAPSDYAIPQGVFTAAPSVPPPAAELVLDGEDDAFYEDDRTTRRPQGWTDPAPDTVALVLLATSDPKRVADLGRALAGTAMVQPVSDALGILAERAELVVVDCAYPTIRVETLLSVAPDLPEGCRVVLWAERPDLEQHLEMIGRGIPPTWVRCGHQAAAHDVATVCRVLLE